MNHRGEATASRSPSEAVSVGKSASRISRGDDATINLPASRDASPRKIHFPNRPPFHPLPTSRPRRHPSTIAGIFVSREDSSRDGRKCAAIVLEFSGPVNRGMSSSSSPRRRHLGRARVSRGAHEAGIRSRDLQIPVIRS